MLSSTTSSSVEEGAFFGSLLKMRPCHRIAPIASVPLATDVRAL
jgi:hypothetical protein